MLTDLEKEMRDVLMAAREVLISYNIDGDNDNIILKIDYSLTDANMKEQQKNKL